MKDVRYLLGSALLLAAPAVMAEEEENNLVFIPSIAYQHKLLSFDQKYSDIPVKIVCNPGCNNISENGRESEFEVYLPIMNLSLTMGYGRFYMTLKSETTLTDSSVSVDETRPPAPVAAFGDYAPYYLNIPGEDTQIRRKDVSLTFGYNVWQGLNVFAGYMEGETKLTPQVGCGFPCNPGVYPAVGVNLALDLANEGRGTYQQKYAEKGPYVGFSYGWQIADTGTLSMSVAYAQMDGSFEDNYVLNAGDFHFNFEGDSTGTSIGLTWSAPLGESSNYFVDVREQRYSMEGDDHDTPSTFFDTVDVETDETMLGVTAGLQFYF